MSSAATSYLVPTAEAAFIADLPDKDMQRLIDQHIVDEPLVVQNNGRLFARIAAAFAKFYFEENPVLTKSARKEVIRQLSERIRLHRRSAEIFGLHEIDLNWNVVLRAQTITLETYVKTARDRQAQVEKARELVLEDPEVMGGLPVFKRTRIPVSLVAGLASAGQTWADLREDYPSLTAEMFDAAKTYQAVSPRRGRPPAEQAPWKLKSTKVLKPASRPE